MKGGIEGRLKTDATRSGRKELGEGIEPDNAPVNVAAEERLDAGVLVEGLQNGLNVVIGRVAGRRRQWVLGVTGCTVGKVRRVVLELQPEVRAERAI